MEPAATKVRRVGVYGGTFDPVHRAHIALAHAAKQQLALDEVWFVPCGDPPHRSAALASGEHRLNMLRLATAHNQSFSVDDWELHQPGKTYSYKTIEQMKERHNWQIFFLLGLDSLHQFTSWRHWQRILETCHLAVASRPGLDLCAIPEVLQSRLVKSSDATNNTKELEGVGQIVVMDFNEMPVSSTEIRAHLADEAQSLDALLKDHIDPAVLGYIRENRLYQYV